MIAAKIMQRPDYDAAMFLPLDGPVEQYPHGGSHEVRVTLVLPCDGMAPARAIMDHIEVAVLYATIFLSDRSGVRWPSSVDRNVAFEASIVDRGTA